MSSKIDSVTEAVPENIEIMGSVIDNIAAISSSMQALRTAAVEVNAALEESAGDTQKLSNMTHEVFEDATVSADYAQGISNIDDRLSEVILHMYGGLNQGDNAMKNEELKEILEKAKAAHISWAAKLKKMVDTMSLDALQTNSKKCAFGHFYHALQVEHPMLCDEWANIDGLHHQVHSSGDEIIVAIKNGDSNKANSLYRNTEQLSGQMVAALDHLEVIIDDMISQGIQLFA